MGPSGLEMGVGGDLGLRGDLLSRTSQGPGVSICREPSLASSWIRDGCGEDEGVGG
jgi:hypothetical protein